MNTAETMSGMYQGYQQEGYQTSTMQQPASEGGDGGTYLGYTPMQMAPQYDGVRYGDQVSMSPYGRQGMQYDQQQKYMMPTPEQQDRSYDSKTNASALPEPQIGEKMIPPPPAGGMVPGNDRPQNPVRVN
uniref:Uncharacterized protein n=1 Tax=Lygus hesperus TaxID=30085 RepID=A0A146LDN3_LYGHE